MDPRRRPAPSSRRPPCRRGATTVELAIVLMVFLTLIFGMLDLGIAVLRYHQLAQAARLGAREAVVHGSLADKLGTWGPGGYSGTANDTGTPLVAAIQPALVGQDLSHVQVDAQWLGGNDPRQGHRIRVTVSAPYQPIMLFIFSTSFTLSASSTMTIAH